MNRLFHINRWFLIFAFLLVFPAHVFSEENEDILIQSHIENEIREFDKFIKGYNHLVANPRPSFFMIEMVVNNSKAKLKNFIPTYRAFLKQGGNEFVLNEAIAGTDMICKSLDDILYGRDHKKTEKALNEGIEKLRTAQKSIERVRWFNGLSYGFSFNSLSVGKFLFFVYFYLILIGLGLKLSFKTRLKQLMEGRHKKGKFKEDFIYGVHLIILFPVLFAFLFFIILLVWDLSWVGLYVLKTVPGFAKIILLFLIVLIFSVLALLFSVLTAQKKYDGGIVFTKDTRTIEPMLWSLCDEVAKAVGTKPVDRIVVSPNPGIGVYETGGLFKLLLGRQERVLLIGIGSITGLTISQMKAILGHEFGHFSHRDTSWSTLTHTMSSIVHNSLEQMSSMQETDSLLLHIVAVCNPAFWVLMAYRYLFLLMTSGFSKVREVYADKTAISLYGHRHFSEALLKIAKNDVIFFNYYLPERVARVQQDRMSDRQLFCNIEMAFQSIEKSMSSNIEAAIFEEQATGMYHTHPPLKSRLSYAIHFDEKVQVEDQNASFRTVFNSWDEISKILSEVYI